MNIYYKNNDIYFIYDDKVFVFGTHGIINRSIYYLAEDLIGQVEHVPTTKEQEIIDNFLIKQL